jgi:cytoskeletal protein CcmA (bactofilin family)
MAFDLLDLLRDRALIEVALAVAAMATVSALLSFALTAALRRVSRPTLLAFAALLAVSLAPRGGQAHFGLHEHRDYTLPAGEVHDGSLFASGQAVHIDGIVEGDLLVFARRLFVRGEVHGNVYALVAHAEITGVVTGSAHAVAHGVRVAGRVDESLYFAAESVDLAPVARVGRDASVVSEELNLEGAVTRDLFAQAERVELRGAVGRDVHVSSRVLALRDGARVGRDVEARLPQGTQPELASGAVVAGELRSHAREHGRPRGLARLAEPRFWIFLALHVGAGFAAGMVLHALLPGLFAARLETAGAFFRTLGLGFAAVVLAPLALLFTALTLVGLPLALMGLALYLAALYASGLLVAFLVGRSLVQPRGEGARGFGLALLAGLVIVVLATHAPFLGGVLRAVTILTGVGLLLERARRGWPALRAQPL